MNLYASNLLWIWIHANVLTMAVQTLMMFEIEQNVLAAEGSRYTNHCELLSVPLSMFLFTVRGMPPCLHIPNA